MAEYMNRRMLLSHRPTWTATKDDFTVEKVQTPSPGHGEVLVRVVWLAFDPAMRGWMSEGASYAPPVPLGEVMRGHGVGQVVETGEGGLPVGTLVTGNFGWQEYVLARAERNPVEQLAHINDERLGVPAARKVPDGVPPTAMLGVLGTTGLTAYFGMLELGRPRPGDVVLVSGAAGATGSVAGQLAKFAGARVIGTAGGAEKAKWLTEVAGFDEAIDYRNEDVQQRIGELAPKGVNIFYDNVAGPMLQAGIANIAQRGTLVLCGGVSSGYSNEATPYGPTNMSTLTVRRCRAKGFIVTDYVDQFDDASERLTSWVRSGDLVWADDIARGDVEDTVDTMNRLFDGKNLGKQLLQISDLVA